LKKKRGVKRTKKNKGEMVGKGEEGFKQDHLG